jgi:hypothetical protein
MRKAYCDRCGTECVNGTCCVFICTEHTTSGGELVGQENAASELCLSCGEEGRTLLGLKETTGPVMFDDEGMPEPVTSSELRRRLGRP